MYVGPFIVTMADLEKRNHSNAYWYCRDGLRYLDFMHCNRISNDFHKSTLIGGCKMCQSNKAMFHDHDMFHDRNLKRARLLQLHQWAG